VRYDNADATTGGLTGPIGVRPLVATGRPAALNEAALADTSDVRVTAAAPPAMDAPRTVRSVVFASPSAGAAGTTTTISQDLGGNTLNIASGGLLRGSRGVTAANAATDFFVIDNGTITAGGTGAGGTLFVTVQESGNTTNQLHVNAAITDNGGSAVGLAKNGAGLLILRGNNTYTGGTVVNEGQIQPEYAPGVNPLGTGPITMVAGTLQMRSDQPVTNAGNNMITDGANPRLFGGRLPANPATAGPVAFNFGTLTVKNTSGLPVVQFDFETNPGSFAAASPTDAATFSFGQTTINADTIFNVTREGTAPNFRNTVVRLAGVTDGAGSFSLIKSSNGFLEITGPSTYDDGTFVNLGRLTVSGAGTLGTGPVTVNGGSLLANSASTGPGAVTVNNTGLLGGTGGVGGPVTVNPGGTLAPGAAGGGTGTLTASGPVTFGGTTGTPPVFLVELAPGGTSDVLALSGTGAAGLLTLTNPDTLSLVTDNTGTYTISTFASRVGEFDSVLMNGFPATFGAPGSGRDVEIAYNANNIRVTVNNVVPEPATAGVLLAMAAVGLLARRRRALRA
jgi:autotransporter-associated beta strand protein